MKIPFSFRYHSILSHGSANFQYLLNKRPTPATFKYRKNVALGSAEFLYDNKVEIVKEETKLLGIYAIGEIDVNSDSRMLDKDIYEIDRKSKNQLVESFEVQQLDYTKGKLLSNITRGIIPIEKTQEVELLNLSEPRELFLTQNDNYLSNISIPREIFFQKYNKALEIPWIVEINKNFAQNLSIQDLIKDADITITTAKFVYDETRNNHEIDKASSNKYIKKPNFEELEKNSNAVFTTLADGGSHIVGIDKNTPSKYLSNRRLPLIDKILNTKMISVENLCNIYRTNATKICKILNLKSVDKINKAQMLRILNITNIFKNPIVKGAKRLAQVNIVKPFKTQMLKRFNYVITDKVNVMKSTKDITITNIKKKISNILVNDVTITPIWKRATAYSTKDVTITPIIYKQPIYIQPDVIRPIWIRKDAVTLNREVAVPILIKESLSVNRFQLIDVAKNTKYYPLEKDQLEVISEINKTNFLEITKRWWVIPAGNEVDMKILPVDYDYKQYPLLGNSLLGQPYMRVDYSLKDEDLSQQDYINQLIKNMEIAYYNKHKTTPLYKAKPQLYEYHPTSPEINPYAVGDDRMGGLYEIPLAINIMVEMVNLVGLIVQHEGTQLCYCTGKEAMWFILEALRRWMYLDSTLEQMNNLGVLEHYQRCYRWIRWEAEKVFFNCDYDTTRFMGIKYAGELFSNLILYLKNHHFNVVPIWKPLKVMDWQRANSKDPSKDIIIKLDKIKGPRHLNIETQKLDKKASEGIPRNNNGGVI